MTLLKKYNLFLLKPLNKDDHDDNDYNIASKNRHTICNKYEAIGPLVPLVISRAVMTVYLLYEFVYFSRLRIHSIFYS